MLSEARPGGAAQSQEALQSSLLRTLAGPVGQPSAVFVLGSPRTGSTLLYQAISFGLSLPYIANLTNDYFAETPILGLTMQAGLARHIVPSFRSSFGKTTGLLQPSEGSAVMRTWFGGDHPSQSRSARFVPGARARCEETLAAAFALNARPLVIKNAWNCFRIEDIASMDGKPAFVWIRRDIGDAAKSDLSARYVVQGSNQTWNSATPANVEALRSRPYWEQVVENQFEFNRAVGEALRTLHPGRYIEVWYERFCSDPVGELQRIARSIGIATSPSADAISPPGLAEAKDWSLHPGDDERIESYVRGQEARLAPHRFAG